MNNIAKRGYINSEKYPFFFELFEEALLLISVKEDRDDFFLWRIVQAGDEAVLNWERWIRKASKILCFDNPKVFVKTFDIIPNDFAGDPGRFQDSMAEIYILLALQHLGFSEIRKIKASNKKVNPDYTAFFLTERFFIEVWHCRRNDGKEMRTRDERGVYDLIMLDEIFTDVVRNNLSKFSRQFENYSGYKTMAAIYYKWQTQGIFVDYQRIEKIAKKLMLQTNGIITHFLFMSMYENLKDFNETFVIPKLPI